MSTAGSLLAAKVILAAQFYEDGDPSHTYTAAQTNYNITQM